MTGLFNAEFVAMIVGIIVSLLIALVPQFEGIKPALIIVVGSLVGLVIAALGGERIAAARASGATQAERQALGIKGYSLQPTAKAPYTKE